MFLKENWATAILFAIAIMIRIYRIGDLSFYDDEILTVMRVQSSFIDAINLAKHTAFPPLYPAILNVWTGLFGTSEWVSRFPSAIFSGLTIVIVYKLGRELFNHNAGFIAALLLVFSPFAITHAQSARMYSLFWFLEAASFLYFFRFLKSSSSKAYIPYVVSITLCCYTVYLGWLFVIAQNIIYFLFGKKEERKKWFLSQGIILFVCVPWIILFLCSQHEKWDLRSGVNELNLFKIFLRSCFVIFGGAYELMMHKSWSEYLLNLYLWRANFFVYVFFVVSFLIDLWTSTYNRINKSITLPREPYYLFIWIIISTAAYFIYAYCAKEINLAVRYFGFIQVPVILLVSSQINNLQSIMRTIIICVLLSVGISNTAIYLRDVSLYPFQDWRGMAIDLTHVLKKDDVVLSFIYIPQFQYYFKADVSQFYPLKSNDWRREDLLNGIINKENTSVYVLYKQQEVPGISLPGFILDRTAYYGGMGYLHFKRSE